MPRSTKKQTFPNERHNRVNRKEAKPEPPEAKKPSATGPRLPTGKARSSRNALKHGLLAREVVITQGRGAEDPAEFDELLAETRDIYQPRDQRQEVLVHRIAACTWRLARAHRFEVGAIRERIDAGPEAPDPNQPDLDDDIAEAEARLAAHRQTLQALQDDPDLDVFDEDRTTELDEALREVLVRYRCLARTVRSLPLGREMMRDFLDNAGLRGKALGRAVVEVQTRIVDREQRRLDKLRLCRQRAELDKEFQGERAKLLCALPASDHLKLLVRYETLIDRQLQRAIDQLDRLQQSMSFEPSPPAEDRCSTAPPAPMAVTLPAGPPPSQPPNHSTAPPKDPPDSPDTIQDTNKAPSHPPRPKRADSIFAKRTRYFEAPLTPENRQNLRQPRSFSGETPHSAIRNPQSPLRTRLSGLVLGA